MNPSVQYNRENLWTAEQNRQIFHWDEILRKWAQSGATSPYIDTVINNLKAAADPSSPHNPPLTHFLKFLNWEQEGIKWLLYECIASRWFFGDYRLDFIKDLVEEHIEDLDSCFPAFPCSPITLTVREFVNANLNPQELEELDMMPPLIAQPFSTPAAQLNTFSALSSNENKPTRSAHCPAIEIRFLRTPTSDANTDDRIRIWPTNAVNIYSVQYEDGLKKVFRDFTFRRSEVIEYLSTVFRAIHIDTEPFCGVQVLLPGAPTNLFRARMDSYTRNLIYEGIEQTMRSWPVEV